MVGSDRPNWIEERVPSLVLVDNSQSPPRVFERGEFLGSGGFARVYSITDRSTGIHFADKVINKEGFPLSKKQRNARGKVRREILMSRISRYNRLVLQDLAESRSLYKSV